MIVNDVARVLHFTVEDSGTEWRVTAWVFGDESVTIDAEADDDIMPHVWFFEELICDDTIPTAKDIQEAIDAENERRYDLWAESQYERY